MNQLTTLERLAEEGASEQKSRAKHRRIGLLLLVVLLAAMGIDYLLYWPSSVKKQNAVLATLNSLPVPADTVQEHSWSGHQPRHGSASRTLVSPQPAYNVCEFFARQLIARGWQNDRNRCDEFLNSDYLSPEYVRSGYEVLQFHRADEYLRVNYLGRNGGKTSYIVFLGWPYS